VVGVEAEIGDPAQPFLEEDPELDAGERAAREVIDELVT